MAHRKVSIWKYVKTENGWRYCRAVIGSSNKIRPNFVWYKKRVEEHSEGYYCLNIGGKWMSAGTSAVEAVKRQKDEEARLFALSRGWDIANAPAESAETISDAITDYMDEYRIGNKEKTAKQMRQTLGEFEEVCKERQKRLLSDLTKKDVMAYWQWALDHSPTRSRRTASNKTYRVHSFLKMRGLIFIGKSADKWQVPEYVEELPEIYSDEELQRFFAACDPFNELIFQTLLKAGLREKELVYLEKRDLNFKRGTLKVSVKPYYEFDTKTYHEREIAIPEELVERLKSLVATTASNLVFPTNTGRPNHKLLRTCKRIARRAGLNCGRCEHKGKQKQLNCREHDVCEQWFLHKFRATFASTNLQRGMDIKTVQYQLGHNDIQSTMRYVTPLRSEQLREKVNEIWAKADQARAEAGAAVSRLVQ
jgi:integrase